MSSVSVFGPLVRLSPPPSEKDYFFNLGDSEGICDLFDVPMISMWSLIKEVRQFCKAIPKMKPVMCKQRFVFLDNIFIFMLANHCYPAKLNFQFNITV